MNKHKFKMSGELDAFKYNVRQFTACRLLEAINKKCVDILLGNTDDEYEVEFYTGNHFGNKRRIKPYFLPWELSELAYYAICFSNDYRGSGEITDDDLGLLVLNYRKFSEGINKKIADTFKDNILNVECYLYGISGEQFKTQQFGVALDNAGRDQYILFNVAKRKIADIDLEEVVKRKCGTSWQSVSASLLLASCLSLKKVNHLDSFDTDLDEDEWIKNDYLSIIKQYTASYTEVRSSPMKQQFLKTKPYIQTQNNHIVSINPFLNLSLYEHSLLWIIRDDFHYKEGIPFPSLFGELFETYVDEVLDHCLDKNEYERIPTSKEKRADIKICVNDYKFLVEQKSALLKLNAKQQKTSIEDVKAFIKNDVLEAIEQLEATEKYYDNGAYIKIILLYEDYFPMNIADTAFKMDECTAKNDNNYWTMSINEFEILFGLKKYCQGVFNSIVKDMLSNPSDDSHSISSLFIQHSVSENMYIKNSPVKQYVDAGYDFVYKHFNSIVTD